MKTSPWVVTVLAFLVVTAAAADATVTFDNGPEGWIGAASVEPTGGNPGANFHTFIIDTFGVTYRNDTSADFIGDYTQSSSVTLAIDVKVDLITFFGSPVSRPWLVELRDYDNAAPAPYVSVWYKFTDISSGTTGNWTTFSVTIEDTSAVDLPAGWGGTGAEDPKTFEPMLPPGRTFTDVLASVDEIAFTTFEPGFFFGFTNFDMRVDNISITTGSSGPGAIANLRMGRLPDGDLELGWDPDCGDASRYAVYRGDMSLGFDSAVPEPGLCATPATTANLAPGPGGADYFLVVPVQQPGLEGSYGYQSDGTPRQTSFGACFSQGAVNSCAAE